VTALYYALARIGPGQQTDLSDPANPSPGGMATLHVKALNLGDKVEATLGGLLPGCNTTWIGDRTGYNYKSDPPQGSNDVTFIGCAANNNPISVFR